MLDTMFTKELATIVFDTTALGTMVTTGLDTITVKVVASIAIAQASCNKKESPV